MKLYLIYLRSKNRLYAITDIRDYLERFCSERNPRCFSVCINKFSKEDGLAFMTKYSSLKLQEIPLESEDGDCSIIGTIHEEYMFNVVCENMAESCDQLKLYFTKNVPFNNEYKELLDSLTTITKDENFHPIIQMNTVKLFYYIFRDTFVEDNDVKLLNTDTGYLNEIISKYKNHIV